MRNAFICIVAFSLLPVTPLLAKDDKEKADAVSSTDPDQVIRCRKIEVIGSLVKKTKVCKTVAEWRAINDNNNYLARRMVEDGTTRPNGQ